MRPIRRGASPIAGDYEDYNDARPDLVSRLGMYCSYCERRVSDVIEVEHVQPKSLEAHAHLVGRWTNFLLACRNCNAIKGHRDVALSRVLLPDRDNTFSALAYAADGSVLPAETATARAQRLAAALLELAGLDRPTANFTDENGRLVALDRVSQRMQAWGVAEEARREIASHPRNQALRRQVARTAVEAGFFSVWMTVFAEDADMRNRFIDAFPGTRESGCFDADSAPVTPAPNPDGLPYGGKS